MRPSETEGAQARVPLLCDLPALSGCPPGPEPRPGTHRRAAPVLVVCFLEARAHALRSYQSMCSHTESARPSRIQYCPDAFAPLAEMTPIARKVKHRTHGLLHPARLLA